MFSFLGACSHKQGDKNGSFLILKLRSGIDNAGLMVLRHGWVWGEIEQVISGPNLVSRRGDVG